MFIIDISWGEVAKQVISTAESLRISADLINRYPHRFLCGTDEVAPRNQENISASTSNTNGMPLSLLHDGRNPSS
jgi:hypothetical protein